MTKSTIVKYVAAAVATAVAAAALFMGTTIGVNSFKHKAEDGSCTLKISERLNPANMFRKTDKIPTGQQATQ